MPSTRRAGRPRKHLTDEQKRKAGVQASIASAKRSGFQSQTDYAKKKNWKYQVAYQRRTGFASQKKYREKKREEKRLMILAANPPQPLAPNNIPPAVPEPEDVPLQTQPSLPPLSRCALSLCPTEIILPMPAASEEKLNN